MRIPRVVSSVLYIVIGVTLAIIFTMLVIYGVISIWQAALELPRELAYPFLRFYLFTLFLLLIMIYVIVMGLFLFIIYEESKKIWNQLKEIWFEWSRTPRRWMIKKLIMINMIPLGACQLILYYVIGARMLMVYQSASYVLIIGSIFSCVGVLPFLSLCLIIKHGIVLKKSVLATFIILTMINLGWIFFNMLMFIPWMYGISLSITPRGG